MALRPVFPRSSRGVAALLAAMHLTMGPAGCDRKAASAAPDRPAISTPNRGVRSADRQAELRRLILAEAMRLGPGIDTIQDSDTKDMAAADLAAALAIGGDADRARELAGKIKDSTFRSTALICTAGAIARDGTLDRAIAVVEEIPNQKMKTEQGWLAVARALARKGDIDSARQVAARAGDPLQIAHNLIEVAAVLKARGDARAAIALLGSVFDGRTAWGDPKRAVDTLCDLAKAQAKAGDARGAAITAAAIDDREYGKQWVLNEVLQAQAWAGDLAGVRATTAQIRDPSPEYQIIARARSGDLSGARQDAEAAWKTKPDVTCRAVVALIQAELKDREGAKAAFDAIDRDIPPGMDAKSANEQRTILAMIRAEAGDFDGAYRTVERMTTSVEREGLDLAMGKLERVVALCLVARAQGVSGDTPSAAARLRAARDSMGRIDDPRLGAVVLTEIAAAQSHASDEEGAAASLDELVPRLNAMLVERERQLAVVHAYKRLLGAGSVAGALKLIALSPSPARKIGVLQDIARWVDEPKLDTISVRPE